MKIIYIVNTRMPTEKAHGYQIVKVCQGLAALGHKVELWVPKRLNFISQNIFDYYKIENNFKINYLGGVDFFRFEKVIGSQLAFLGQSLFFSLAVLIKRPQAEIIYTRNPEVVWVLKKQSKVVFSAHNFPSSKVKRLLQKIFLRFGAGIVANSRGTKTAYAEYGFNNLIVAPNGVDLEDFCLKETNDKVIDSLNLPANKLVVMYVGHLYKWKGVETIIETAKKINDDKFIFVIVGGTKEDVKKYKTIIKAEGIGNVILTGDRPHDLIPQYLQLADVLLLPNVATSNESINFTSPIKMFEYMAAGKPIIASKLPSIGEILNNYNATLVTPGDSGDLVKELLNFKQNPLTFKEKAEVAKKDVLVYTWDNHVRKLTTFFDNICAE